MPVIKILYLEDEKKDVDLIKALLEAENINFNLTHVYTKSDFLKNLKENQFNLILLDYSLPEFDGLAALSHAKKLCPDIPVIIISGTIGEEIAIETLKKGATDYILKQRTSRFIPAIKRALKEAEELKKRKKAEDQIKLSLREKEILLKEIHHRVKNNLQIIISLLKLQSKQLNDPRLSEAFQKSIDRIHSMALIHEQLYQSSDFSQINLKNYIKPMVYHLFHAYRIGDQIRLKLNLEDVVIKIDKAIPCGMILNELVSNALKHAFPQNQQGEIEIKLIKLPQNKCDLIVRDNGVGVPDNFELNQTQSMGMHLVNILVNQIEGSIKLIRKNGTIFDVIFPV